MSGSPRLSAGFAALNGFVAVALGAFAAHAIDDPQSQEWLRTGAHYQIVHALALLAAAQPGLARARLARDFFAVGLVIFPGALYALAFGAPRWLGAVAPVGGVSFLLGWAALAYAFLAPPPKEPRG